MRVEYLPRVNEQLSKIRDFAIAVLLPNTFPGASTKKWKWGMLVHGIGELSDGRQSHLEQLAVKGFDWNNDGKADSFFTSEDMKKAVDLHELILVIPTYSTSLEPAEINKIYDHMLANYQAQPTFTMEGFSLGGGAVYKYASSNETNAKRVHLAIPVAGVYGLVSASVAAKSGTIWHAFSNDKDDRVNVSNTKNQIDQINGQNPAIKAQYTIFRVDGHGGDKEAMALIPPKAPGGQGVTDAAETMYQLNDAILASGPRQMKTGTVIQPPAPPDPTTPPVSTDPVAAFNLTDGQVITTATFKLDASASQNVKSDWQGYAWDVKPVENGSWGTMPEGGMYGGPLKNLVQLVNGKYEIALTVTSKDGKKNKKAVIVTVNIGLTPIPKTMTGFDSATDLITYSDGSTEKGTAVFSDGKWSVKNSAGQIVNL